MTPPNIKEKYLEVFKDETKNDNPEVGKTIEPPLKGVDWNKYSNHTSLDQKNFLGSLKYDFYILMLVNFIKFIKLFFFKIFFHFIFNILYFISVIFLFYFDKNLFFLKIFLIF